jgi:hypothetical protein
LLEVRQTMQRRDQARPGRAHNPDQEARARSFVDTVPWRFARTVPEHPHWYALRVWLSPEQQVVFDWFTDLIACHGYTGWFWGRDWTYLDLGDGFKYWESRTLDKAGRIINRTRTRESEDLKPLRS